MADDEKVTLGDLDAAGEILLRSGLGMSAQRGKHERPARQTLALGAKRPLLSSSSISSSCTTTPKRDRTKSLILSGEHFVRSPLSWRDPIYQSPHGWAAIRVADAIWYYAGSQGTDTVRLNLSRLHAFGLKRRMTATEGLATLEGLGLVRVTRNGRQSAIVTIQRPDRAEPQPEAVFEQIRAELDGRMAYVLRCKLCRRSPKFAPTEWRSVLEHYARRHRKAFEAYGQEAVEVSGTWEPTKRAARV